MTSEEKEIQQIYDRLKILEDQFLTLQKEHNRFFKTELLNIRNDISDMKRNVRRR